VHNFIAGYGIAREAGVSDEGIAPGQLPVRKIPHRPTPSKCGFVVIYPQQDGTNRRILQPGSLIGKIVLAESAKKGKSFLRTTVEEHAAHDYEAQHPDNGVGHMQVTGG
jgi:hypothetical protein